MPRPKCSVPDGSATGTRAGGIDSARRYLETLTLIVVEPLRAFRLEANFQSTAAKRRGHILRAVADLARKGVCTLAFHIDGSYHTSGFRMENRNDDFRKRVAERSQIPRIGSHISHADGSLVPNGYAGESLLHWKRRISRCPRAAVPGVGSARGATVSNDGHQLAAHETPVQRQFPRLRTASARCFARSARSPPHATIERIRFKVSFAPLIHFAPRLLKRLRVNFLWNSSGTSMPRTASIWRASGACSGPWRSARNDKSCAERFREAASRMCTRGREPACPDLQWENS